MSDKTKKVAIIFGGQSAEHEVSINSTRALYKYIDKEKFTPVLIYISRDGLWRVIDEQAFQNGDFSAPGFSFLPWVTGTVPGLPSIDADIYFPMLHGPNGEDGKIQGLLEMAGKTYVGANSVSSALAMDKTVAKIMFNNAGITTARGVCFQSCDYDAARRTVAREFTYPVFVKPVFLGSAVGVSKVHDESQLKAALDLAFRYDHKILVEEYIDGREIEVSVMGNAEIMVSRPGELVPHNEFYDYNDKYVDGKTTFHIPAQLEKEQEEEIRRIAGKAYKTLYLNGFARVDFFLENDTGRILMNEINTIPGFTQISMFPKLWSLQGISFTQLITRLIDYGIRYHAGPKADTRL